MHIKHFKTKLIVLLGIISFFTLLFVPTPAGLSLEGKRALAVFVLSLSLWVTNYLPLAITSLMGIALIPLLNIMSVEKTYSTFGNNAIFFILGALMLAASLYKTGLGSRLAYILISRFDSNPQNITVGILLSSAVLSFIMPEHAVAAMLFPIVFEIVETLKLKPLRSKFAKSLFLSLAWGAVIGGITTYLGGARSLLAVGILQKNYDLTVGFFEWIKYSLPYTIILLIAAYFMILKAFPSEIDDLGSAFEELEGKILEMGKLSTNEKKLIFVFIGVIFSWVFFSAQIDISIIAILGGVLIFILDILDWQDIEEYINWGVILMYGGAIVIATALTDSGAALWLADQTFKVIPLSPVVFILLFALVTKVLTEGVSNVAAVAIVIPLAFSVGQVLGLNPVAITLLIALPGGLAFCLPMGAPPNAIAFSSGYLDLAEVFKLGLWMNLISIIAIYLVSEFYWPLVGLELVP
ncbi:MAG: SLC13 family permease [Bacillota bacterium]